MAADEHAEQMRRTEQPQHSARAPQLQLPMQVAKEHCSWRWIVSYFVIIMAALALTTPCMGQDKAKVNPAMTADMIGRVLAKARASGSLVYHGQCQDRGETWDLPAVNSPKQRETNPVQILREMFADDSKMQVARDINGNIRMVETDVPRDLLDLRIVQVPFASDSRIHDPRVAVSQIMVTPDVKN